MYIQSLQLLLNCVQFENTILNTLINSIKAVECFYRSDKCIIADWKMFSCLKIKLVQNWLIKLKIIG